MLEVLRAGLLTTVQDLGRRAREVGVPQGGALDPVSLRTANLLVGNPQGAPALEVTLLGPALRFHAQAVVAVAGAELDLTLDGVPARTWAPFSARARQVLTLGEVRGGARAYLALRGGIQGDEVFGSLATDLRGGFGGHRGRALRRGDVLGWNEAPPVTPPRLFVNHTFVNHAGRPLPRRVVRLRALRSAAGGWEKMVNTAWTVGTASDRMGLRLAGPTLPGQRADRASEPTVPGMVQLPPGGAPIVLLADSGTHGGYARPLTVIRADLAALGQLRPRQRIVFQLVTFQQARSALAAQEAALARLARAVEYAYARPH